MQSKARHVVSIALAVAALVGALEMLRNADSATGLWLLVVASSLLGVGVTLPIGGADMPVVISLLSSFSVLQQRTGFVVGSQMLIVAGAMVGAAGLILTQVMCNGMNRSLVSVLLEVPWVPACRPVAVVVVLNITSAASRNALTMEAAERVVIVPGYGLAVLRRNTPCVRSPAFWKALASMWPMPSIPWRDGCPVT